MFDRLSRSWRLFKASASVLVQDQELLLFPLISLAALFVLALSFAAPVIGVAFMGGFNAHGGGGMRIAGYVLAFLFYFSQYFIIFFFNTALVGAAMIRLDGGTPTFRDGMRIASDRIGAIATYALIAATVGLILRVIQERAGFIGRIVVALLGFAWSVATYLVVPVLAVRKVSAFDAVKESANLIKATWGENVIGQMGLGAVFSFVFLGVIGLGILLVAAAVMTHSVAAIVIALIVCILLLGITGLVHTALTGIYSAALYRWATTGEDTMGFHPDTLRLAFAPR
jgi:hypothetical protein